MISETIYKDTETKKVFKMCNICGCTIKHPNNFKRHLKSRRHNEVYYINNNRFEIERIKTKREEKNEIIILK